MLSLSPLPNDGVLYSALQSTQATGSLVHLCHGGNAALKVTSAVCNAMNDSNFSRSCEGEWKKGQEEFKRAVLQTE